MVYLWTYLYGVFVAQAYVYGIISMLQAYICCTYVAQTYIYGISMLQAYISSISMVQAYIHGTSSYSTGEKDVVGLEDRQWKLFILSAVAVMMTL